MIIILGINSHLGAEFELDNRSDCGDAKTQRKADQGVQHY